MGTAKEALIARHIWHMRREQLAESYIRRRVCVLNSVAAVIGKPAELATAADLRCWHDGLTVKPDAARMMTGHVRQFYRWLADQGIRADNPAGQFYRLEHPRQAHRIVRLLSEADLQRDLAARAPRARRPKETLTARHIRHMRRARLSESYIRRRVGVLTSVAAVIGKPVELATAADLRRWHDSLALQPDTVLMMVGHVRQFYRWLADEGIRSENPAARLERPRRIRRVPRPISETDLTHALAEAPARERIMLVLACQLGMRCCEIAGLRWESITLGGKHPALLVTWDTAKGRRERVLPLPPWVIAELHRYGVQNAGWLIPRLDGKPGPNTAARISRLLAEYLHDLGIAATAHHGRHRFATAILDAGGNLRDVQEALGHADLSNVQIYTLVRPAALAAAIAAVPVPEP